MFVFQFLCGLGKRIMVCNEFVVLYFFVGWVLKFCGGRMVECIVRMKIFQQYSSKVHAQKRSAVEERIDV